MTKARTRYILGVDLGGTNLRVALVGDDGTVRVRRMKHDIEDIAANCPGVEDIENRIRVTVD